jgi:hypothetical protein
VLLPVVDVDIRRTMTDRIKRTEKLARKLAILREAGVKWYRFAGAAVTGACKTIALASKKRHTAETIAVTIAMQYPEADAAWKDALVKRAYEVADRRSRTTPADVLGELLMKQIRSGFKAPFGTPKEMIPG